MVLGHRMEATALQAVRRVVSHASKDACLAALLQCDNDAERAINMLIDGGLCGEEAPTTSSSQQDMPRATMPQVEAVAAASVSAPTANAVAQALGSLPAKISLPTFQSYDDGKPPSAGIVGYHTDLDNGDCVFFSMWHILKMLHGGTLRTIRKATVAANIRDLVFQYIDSHWSHTSAIAQMSWCDLITMSHNTAITDEEQEDHPSWGETDEERLAAWRSERDELYGTVPEITAFLEILKLEHGVKLGIRVWRLDAHTKQRTISALIPSVLESDAIIADLQHSGEMDTNNAHYRLLDAGSFRIARRRETSDDDPDYEPDTSRFAKRKR